ncbi:hypothetical protein [Nonomuraea sp. NPDC005650]|uniref:hypothetical protein n=1 Tax=Nonomuraea sp. NPDC005650 TaxID=3157045 RepID=UPI00339FE07A
MKLIGVVRKRIITAGNWYGRRIVARPIAALMIIGVIAAVCLFLLGVAISLATGEQPIPWWRYVRTGVIEVLVWLGVALFVRSRLRKDT